jgi:hypothetical protein
MAFETPRAPQDEWTARLYERHGLPEEPSARDIEPVAKKLWEDPDSRREAAELMLGHRIDARALEADPDTRGVIAVLRDPAEAFGMLLLLRSVQRHEREG